MTLLTQAFSTTKIIENNLLNMTKIDATKVKIARLQYADVYHYLSPAEESGVSKTNILKHQFEAVLAATSNLQASIESANNNQKNSTKVLMINKYASNISAKYVAARTSLLGMLIIFLSLQDYTYLNNSMALAVILVKSISPITMATAMTMPAKSEIKTLTQTKAVTLPLKPFTGLVTEKVAVKPKQNSKLHTKLPAKSNLSNSVAENVRTKKLSVKNSKEVSASSLNDDAVSNLSLRTSADQTTLKNIPIKLFSHMPVMAVAPELLDAYQALNRGEYTIAQQQYQQVLKLDMNNVDALLGMSIITKTQGRNVEAQAWIQLVLAVDPRNAIAQSLLVSLQTNTGSFGTESRLKNMLAQQPEAASFHAALGNLYADQNQWTAAQEAFFKASQFAPDNADYAFNLGISLDQMAQYKLALKQYQKTRTLLNKSGANSPDNASLEARINALASFND